jgi:hypothetical protein
MAGGANMICQFRKVRKFPSLRLITFVRAVPYFTYVGTSRLHHSLTQCDSLVQHGFQPA